MNNQMSQQVTIGATEARNNFSELLKRVYRGKEHLVVEKGGIPVAALIGIPEYEAFQRWQVQEAIERLGRKMAKKAEEMGLDEEGLIASLEEERKDIYQALSRR